MTAEVREVNTALGWRTGENTFGDYIALLHSELSEALEAYRDYRLEDATNPPQPIYRNEEIPKIRHDDVYRTKRVLVGHHPAKPEGVGSEMADVLIRLLDTCDVYGIDLAAEFQRKIAYNRTRPYQHGGRTLSAKETTDG